MKVMRERAYKVNVFLNEDEKNIFEVKSRKAGLSKSEFFRKIILDYKLKEQPDERFYEILSQLRGIANNLNQMARVYQRNAGYVKDYKIQSLLDEVRDLVLSLQEVYIIPQKEAMKNYGYNKTLEIQE